MSVARHARLLIVASILLFAAHSAQAQVTNVTNTTSTPTPGAVHDYIKLLSETVNPGNGSVSVRIQTPTPPGRRLSLPFSVAYDSNGAHNISSDGSGGLFWDDNWSYPAKAGWSYTIPMLSEVLVQESTITGNGQCSYYNDFVFQDETGGRHSLYLTAVNAPPPPANNPCLMATPIRPTQKLSGETTITGPRS